MCSVIDTFGYIKASYVTCLDRTELNRLEKLLSSNCILFRIAELQALLKDIINASML